VDTIRPPNHIGREGGEGGGGRGRVGVELSQVLVEELGEEGSEGGHQHRHGEQDFVESGEAGQSFFVPFLPLETGAVQPYVPREGRKEGK